MIMFTRKFWRDSSERAIKTFFQTLAALLGVAVATPLFAIAWGPMLSVSLTAAVFSLVTSLASAEVASDSTVSPASLVKD